MQYLEALRAVHAALEPASYFEIGSRHGASLALAACPAVAVDPAFELKVPVAAGTRLFEMTSDDFFAAHDPAAILGAPVEFAFIDGMHLAEFALRDFVNLERAAHPTGVIAIDDVLPTDIRYATRERNTRIWTGDVYRTILVLMELRPDLDIRVYDIQMKGFCLVAGLDPASTTLAASLAEIEDRLAAGHWTLASAEAIREQLRPLPPENLAIDLARLAAGRA